MKKSTLNLVKELQIKLLEFPAIVRSLEKKDAFFLQNLLSWINTTEDLLTSNNISKVSELSGLKSKIIAVRFSENKRATLKKMQLQVAAQSLYDIQHIVLEILKPLEAKTEESRELIKQLLLIVSQSKAVEHNPNLPFENLIHDIWQFILSNEQLKGGAVKLKTTLSQTDIQILMAEEINPDDFKKE